MKKWLVLVMGTLLCSGCATVNLADDDETTPDALARIMGDYRVTAGLPVTVTLRSVDGKALKFWQYAADVSSGKHRLLVDCHVVASDKLSRHEMNVDVHAGERYRLVATASPREGCTDIKFVAKY